MGNNGDGEYVLKKLRQISWVDKLLNKSICKKMHFWSLRTDKVKKPLHRINRLFFNGLFLNDDKLQKKQFFRDDSLPKKDHK
jgi:hypothetical protein